MRRHKDGTGSAGSDSTKGDEGEPDKQARCLFCFFLLHLSLFFPFLLVSFVSFCMGVPVEVKPIWNTSQILFESHVCHKPLFYWRVGYIKGESGSIA